MSTFYMFMSNVDSPPCAIATITTVELSVICFLCRCRRVIADSSVATDHQAARCSHDHKYSVLGRIPTLVYLVPDCTVLG